MEKMADTPIPLRKQIAMGMHEEMYAGDKKMKSSMKKKPMKRGGKPKGKRMRKSY